ncbi:glycosyltransferase family 2 protein [Ancylobacter dichloromethanicus]
MDLAHSSITEDCETALTLHARGWHSVYVDTPLIAGLQPETFASFIGQRSRWAQGMYQILRFHFPLFPVRSDVRAARLLHVQHTFLVLSIFAGDISDISIFTCFFPWKYSTDPVPNSLPIRPYTS